MRDVDVHISDDDSDLNFECQMLNFLIRPGGYLDWYGLIMFCCINFLVGNFYRHASLVTYRNLHSWGIFKEEIGSWQFWCISMKNLYKWVNPQNCVFRKSWKKEAFTNKIRADLPLQICEKRVCKFNRKGVFFSFENIEPSCVIYIVSKR